MINRHIQCHLHACCCGVVSLPGDLVEATPCPLLQRTWLICALHCVLLLLQLLLLCSCVCAHARTCAHIPLLQYFNIPVTSDTADPSNPVNILKVTCPSKSHRLRQHQPTC
jgi:hypothetical protein